MCQNFAGRVFETGHFVQVIVVEYVVERRPYVVEIAEVHEPAGVWIHWAGDGQLDPEAVPVEPGALVAGGHFRQAVSGFETKLMNQSDIHRASTLAPEPPTEQPTLDRNPSPGGGGD